jgi:hypothetical protein
MKLIQFISGFFYSSSAAFKLFSMYILSANWMVSTIAILSIVIIAGVCGLGFIYVIEMLNKLYKKVVKLW